MVTCYCCDRRAIIAALDDCDCSGGTACLNCKRCERHCHCPFDLREIVHDDQAEYELAEPVMVTRAARRDTLYKRADE